MVHKFSMALSSGKEPGHFVKRVSSKHIHIYYSLIFSAESLKAFWVFFKLWYHVYLQNQCMSRLLSCRCLDLALGPPLCYYRLIKVSTCEDSFQHQSQYSSIFLVNRTARLSSVKRTIKTSAFFGNFPSECVFKLELVILLTCITT